MNQPARKPKVKTCKVCKSEFSPRNSLQKACSIPCSLEVVKADKAKEAKKIHRQERAERLDARRRLKTKSEWLREAQAIVNKYVRLRDAHLGCVSCDKGPEWGGQWHASHFRSVKAAPQLRFNTWNIQKSCGVCNNHLSGNILGYRPELIRRLGESRVEWIESFNEIIRYDIEYLKRLKKVFSRKCRLIEARMDGMLSGRMRPRRTIQVSSALPEALLPGLEEWIG